MTNWALEIDKADIRRAGIVETPEAALADGQARLAIDSFALTANNITYAAFGEAMRYWDFFPSGTAGKGRLPVWGFAVVSESRHPDLPVGDRVYGYFPAAAELVVEPAGVTAAGFIDASAHRAELPAPYNRYVRCGGDVGYAARLEAEQMVLQPLFLTGWLLARYLHEENAFGAAQVFLTSASSKTAIGMARSLSGGDALNIELVGLTSPASRDFVDSLDLYDRVVTYPEIGDLPEGMPAVIVDFAGDANINRALHERLGEDLQANIRVGGAHWEQSAPAGDLPGPRPSFFFAPDHVQRVIGELGPGGFQAAYGEAWNDFAVSARDWLAFREFEGRQACCDIYDRLVAGDPIARDGLTIKV
ncbi:DUF2855 family protein [Hyphobacterium sp.]|uniref:DUF2855 family protein n=1 Tax=Hyphobacterium sp. TaxID=2004662 RepID=UPI003B528B2E